MGSASDRVGRSVYFQPGYGWAEKRILEFSASLVACPFSARYNADLKAGPSKEIFPPLRPASDVCLAAEPPLCDEFLCRKDRYASVEFAANVETPPFILQ